MCIRDSGDTQRGQDAGELGDLLQELGVAVLRRVPGDRALVVDRHLVATTIDDVPVEGVVAGMQRAIGEPPIERGAGIVENYGGLLDPVDDLGGLAPEGGRVGCTGGMDLCISAGSHGRMMSEWTTGVV